MAWPTSFWGLAVFDTEKTGGPACHAMTGLLAMQASPNLGGACRNGAYYDHGRADLMAKDAYTIADEMMKARAE